MESSARPLKGKILEVGTGKGKFTTALAKKGYKFISIDISQTQQKLASLNLKYLGLAKSVVFQTENAESLNFAAKSFATIISVNTVHHLDNPYKILNELVRVLDSKGKIILADFSKEGLELVNRIHSQQGGRHSTEEVDFSGLAGYMEKKGFEVEKHRDKFQKILIASR